MKADIRRIGHVGSRVWTIAPLVVVALLMGASALLLTCCSSPGSEQEALESAVAATLTAVAEQPTTPAKSSDLSPTEPKDDAAAVATPADSSSQDTTLPVNQLKVVSMWSKKGYDFPLEDRVYTIRERGQIDAYDRTSSELLWTWDGDWDPQMQGMIEGGDQDTVFISRDHTRVYALDARSGEEKWMALGCSNLAYLDANTAYFGRTSGSTPDCDLLSALSTKDGSVIWTWDSGGKNRLVHPEWSTEQTIVAECFTGANEDIFGVATDTGQTRWRLTCPNGFGGPGMLLCFDSYSGSAAVVDIDSGQELWAKNVEWVGAIGAFDTRIYVAGSVLSWYDWQTGQETISPISGQFLGEAEGKTIITDEKMSFTWAVDAATGQTLWENNDLTFDALLGHTTSTLIGWSCTRDGGFLVGVELETGKRLWRVEGFPCQTSAPARFSGLVLPEGLITANTREKELVLLEPSTGETLSSIPVPSGIVPYYWTSLGDRLFRIESPNHESATIHY